MAGGQRALANVDVSAARFWLDRPTLVTGATGLVGGYVVRRLLDRRASVVALVRDWVPNSLLVRDDLLHRVSSVFGDVRDRALLERILGEYEIDTVIHLAAQTIVSIANRNPVSTFDTNIRGSWALFEACRRSPTVKHIVVASSDKAYGDQGQLPYSEDMPLAGCHPYDVSKSCADLIAQAYARSYRLPVVITRCGNFFGGGDLNFNRVVPGTIRSVIRGERPVIRSDGRYVRDYLYVEDGAEAYLLLAERLAAIPDLRGHAYNFSNETPLTVSDLVYKILGLMGSESEPVVLNEVTNEIRCQTLSAAKAKSELDWRPSFTLEEGLSRTIDFYRAYFSGHAAGDAR